MLKQEIVELYGNTFRKSYSDEGFYILQIETGAEYDIAFDVLDAPYTYQETNKVVEKDE